MNTVARIFLGEDRKLRHIWRGASFAALVFWLLPMAADPLAERVERGGDDLAVEDVAPGREDQLGEVAAQRLAVARLQIGLVAVHEDDCPKAVVLGLVGPAVAFGQGGSRSRELGCERRVQRKRHRAAP